MMGKPYDELIIELLQKRPDAAVELLKAAIEENTPEELAIVIRQIRAAGYNVSITAKPKPAKRPPARRPRARRSAEVVNV